MAGQRIDDLSSWVGKGSDGVVFPAGAKMKKESGEEGAGELMKYEDTAEAIRAGQKEAVKKVKAHPMKQPGYRN